MPQPETFAPEILGAATDPVEWVWHKTDDSAHPDGEEQTYVWLMNRARQDPSAEGAFLAATGDANIQGAIAYFSVDLTMLQQEFDAIAAAPPAAFDRRLYLAAKAHSDDLIARDAQDHTGQFDRVVDAGFTYQQLRGNVFSYAEYALYGHAGFNIDWGYGTGGMQDPRGHRKAIMSTDGDYTNVGIAAVAETDPATNVGPWVVTGNYAKAGTWAEDHYNRFLVGTVWEDLDDDGSYDSGEGLAGVRVEPDSGPFFAETAAGGGYAIPITAAGSYSVEFSGGGLPTTQTRQVVVGDDSVLLDLSEFASPPDLAPVITLIPSLMDGPTNFEVFVECVEVLGADTSGSIVLRMPIDTRWTVTEWDPDATEMPLSGNPIDNSSWTLTTESGFLIFTTNDVIPAGTQLNFGFSAAWDSGQTSGLFAATVNVQAGSGGEALTDKKSDAESADYGS